jgi:hypothetical protein
MTDDECCNFATWDHSAWRQLCCWCWRWQMRRESQQTQSGSITKDGYIFISFSQFSCKSRERNHHDSSSSNSSVNSQSLQTRLRHYSSSLSKANKEEEETSAAAAEHRTRREKHHSKAHQSKHPLFPFFVSSPRHSFVVHQRQRCSSSSSVFCCSLLFIRPMAPMVLLQSAGPLFLDGETPPLVKAAAGL